MANKDLTYSDAIELVMRKNGYFAPLKLLYREIWKYKDGSKISGKTPDMTIQERVQRDPRFTRIGLGVYALTEFLDTLPKEGEPQNHRKKRPGSTPKLRECYSKSAIPEGMSRTPTPMTKSGYSKVKPWEILQP